MKRGKAVIWDLMEWVFIIASYLLGCLPTGVLVARVMGGPDPRLAGSGNIGTTNVLRTLGKKAAVITLLGDLAKGLIPALAARALFPDVSLVPYFAAGAAILGHDFSFLLGFKGGKGVATTFGTLLALSLPIALLSLATWLAVVFLTRYSSAGALSAAAACPLFSLFLGGPARMTLFCAAAAVLLWIQHRKNLIRIMDGTENRIQKPGSM